MTLQESEEQYFFHTYNRLPVEIDHGDGVYLYAKDGKKYLDLFGGLAVNALGYGHPGILNAISEQCKKYIHLSNYYLQEPQIRLAELLVKYSGYRKVFFANSGTEAIEGAVKIVRKWGKINGKPDIVSFNGAFHGRTYGALSLMDRHKYRNGYEPFLDNCVSVPMNDVASLRNAINEKSSSVFLEFVQGAGIVSPAESFIDELKKLKERFGFLLVADEIQSGMGRTGKLFAFEHFSIIPDIVVVAKAIGGGFPLGAILGNSKVADVFEAGDHGSTFGGNPVACAAGIVVMDELMNGGIMKNAGTAGSILRSHLADLQREFPEIIKDVRGYGLMLGMELYCKCEPISAALLKRGILLNYSNENAFRFIPPLIINQEHIQFAIEQLRDVFRSM